MRLIVDRITEGIAVCEAEDESYIRLRVELLPEGTREGSVLVERDGVYVLDREEEEARRQMLFDLQMELFGFDE